MVARLLTPPATINPRPKSDASASVAKEFESECILFFTEVMQVFGIPKSVGQIYGVLYASPVPLSFSDIVEHLDISKGSASQGIQLLRSLGAINVSDYAKHTTIKGTPLSGGDIPRRDYYEPELSLRKLVNGVLHERVAPLAATQAKRMARMRELAEKNQCRDFNCFYLDRSKQLGTWRRRLKSVLPVLSVLLGPKIRK